MTAPKRSRSMTLPIAPPMISPMATARKRAAHPAQPEHQHDDDCRGGQREDQRAETARLNRPKLMPRLQVSTRSKNEVTGR